ncbi:MAG: HDOD domain-containing protein [candidate division Zixibacteria bacterium]|nr:HDOD domain-containing protein [candidate division Zixibacteria bacterium]
MQQVEKLNTSKIQSIVDKVHDLPTPPIVFTQIIKAINDPNTPIEKLAKIISEDPAITAKILKLTNSAFYGIPKTVANINEAIKIIGLEAVKSLVVSTSVFGMFSKNKNICNDYLESFWRHSLLTGFMAKILVSIIKVDTFEEAEMSFLAGLLHDIGKLIIAINMEKEYAEIESIMTNDKSLTAADAETKVLEFTHADIGEYLLNEWNIPDQVGNSVLYHHDSRIVETQPKVALIHIADYLSHEMEVVDGCPQNYLPPSEKTWNLLGLDSHRQADFISLLREQYNKAETFMEMTQGID